MTNFQCWDAEIGDVDNPATVRAPLAYLAAQEYCARLNMSLMNYPLCRTVNVKHPEGFTDAFDVELIMDPIYTAKRKK